MHIIGWKESRIKIIKQFKALKDDRKRKNQKERKRGKTFLCYSLVVWQWGSHVASSYFGFR